MRFTIRTQTETFSIAKLYTIIMPYFNNEIVMVWLCNYQASFAAIAKELFISKRYLLNRKLNRHKTGNRLCWNKAEVRTEANMQHCKTLKILKKSMKKKYYQMTSQFVRLSHNFNA